MSNDQKKPQSDQDNPHSDNPHRGVITAGPDAHANEGSTSATKEKAEREVRQSENNT
ncbi:hypothetical protein ACFSE1_08505 [Rhizobium helianthi]|uniref:Uncharacterized protein n=1 Tax=Rhizobium helianthi TaxID=1132695 RepID=A0ABW4M2Z3_9HYPH